MSNIEEYVLLSFFEVSDRPIFDTTYMRQSEIIYTVSTLMREYLESLELRSVVDPDLLANRIWDEWISFGIFSIEEDEIAGAYFSFQGERYHAFRNERLSGSPIHQRAKRIGDRFYREAFQAARTLTAESDTIDVFLPSIPAADRIVTIDHNQSEDISLKIEAISAELRNNNQVGSDIPDVKDRLVSEFRAGSELIRGRSIRLRAFFEILIKPLKYLADKFASATIGELAKQLLAILLKIVGS
jgi:hypothetical protein